MRDQGVMLSIMGFTTWTVRYGRRCAALLARCQGFHHARDGVWQDAQIDDLLDRVKEEKSPWLLYTCGPMGVGKLLARRFR